MDALLTQTQTPINALPFWDFAVANNVVPILQFPQDQAQQASVLAFTQIGLIPQIPNAGVNWTGLMINQDTISNIDTQITASLNAAKMPYKVSYSTVYVANANQLSIQVVPQ